LNSSETGTKKCQDAEAKGIEIVDEEWIRNQIAGNESATPAKKPKASKAETKSAATVTEGGDRLGGHCFAISGLVCSGNVSLSLSPLTDSDRHSVCVAR
jgi:hypothetical protein